MSRGHGKVQRAVLAQVAEQTDGISMSTLAALVYGVETASQSQLVATRRAVRLLDSGGLVWISGARRATGKAYQRTVDCKLDCKGRDCRWCDKGWHVETADTQAGFREIHPAVRTIDKRGQETQVFPPREPAERLKSLEAIIARSR